MLILRAYEDDAVSLNPEPTATAASRQLGRVGCGPNETTVPARGGEAILWRHPCAGCYNLADIDLRQIHFHESQSMSFLLAQSTLGPSLWPGPLMAVIYGIVGIVLLILGYKLFDWITPQIHVQKELSEKNTAVAIVVAALLLGVAYIVAHVVGG